MKKCIKGILAAAAIAVGMLAGSAHANTIQPIFLNVSDNGNGTFTYHYDVQLTANNGLSSTFLSGGDYASGLIMLDFLGLTGGSKFFVAGDVTAASDWGLDVVDATGGGTAANGGFDDATQNIDWFPSTTLMHGTPVDLDPSISGRDLATVKNVVLSYRGTGLAVDSGPASRNLIHLDLISTVGTHQANKGISLSRDTNVQDNSTEASVESFNYDAPVAGGVPLPSTAVAGMALIGAMGLKKLRRANA